MKKIALLTLLLINLSLSFSLPRNQASPAIFSVTQSAGTILFRHTDSTQTIIPCQSVASIVSNADPSKIVSVWVVQQGDYDKIMQFDYSVCGFSTKQEAVDSVTVWASCVYVSDSAYTTILYTNTDSATITSYDVLNSQNAPPGSPATGDTYLVGTSPSGAWVGHAKDIAEWNGSAWVFTDGVQGDFLYNATTALTYIFRSGNWVQTTGIPALNKGNNISTGLTLGTRNNKDFNFISNNIIRGVFLSNGSFRVANQGLSGNILLGANNLGIQKKIYLGEGLSLSNDTLVSSGGSSALFPNGNEEVLASRDFQLSDAGKILYINEPDVIISMPLVNPFQVGDNIGVLKSELNNSGFSLNGSDIIPLVGENVLITNILSGADVVPVLVSTTTINDGGVDKTALSYLYDKVTNAIPLSGTEVGKPVTGDIEVGADDYVSIIKSAGSDGGKELKIGFFDDSGLFLQTKANGYDGNVYISENRIQINSNSPTSVGLTSPTDFTANITDFDYTQKKYVDNRISDTATQIRSEIPNVSGFATITNLADTSTALRSLISAKVSTTTLTDSLDKKTNKLISFNAYTTSDTLRLTDADKVIEMNVGTANNLVIPTNTAYAFPVGTQIVLIQIGAGQTTLVPASGVTVHSSGSKLKLTGQYSGATIIKKGTNEWYLFGDITN